MTVFNTSHQMIEHNKRNVEVFLRITHERGYQWSFGYDTKTRYLVSYPNHRAEDILHLGTSLYEFANEVRKKLRDGYRVSVRVPKNLKGFCHYHHPDKEWPQMWEEFEASFTPLSV